MIKPGDIMWHCEEVPVNRHTPYLVIDTMTLAIGATFLDLESGNMFTLDRSTLQALLLEKLIYFT